MAVNKSVKMGKNKRSGGSQLRLLGGRNKDAR